MWQDNAAIKWQVQNLEIGDLQPESSEMVDHCNDESAPARCDKTRWHKLAQKHHRFEDLKVAHLE
ncbi:MAG TPA: hypothetical protein EYM44_01640 [Gammaproteobacteria bacterium]|nr:hypothetical protein [Gammaproteobacteria bacterium]